MRDHRITRGCKDQPAAEATSCRGQPDQQIVHSLGSGAFSRGKLVSKQGGTTHKAEIPAQAEQEKRNCQGKYIRRERRGEAGQQQCGSSGQDDGAATPFISQAAGN